ncbi:hypothetical protein [Streptomyces sp. Tue6028]|uniref:hypothetical protein n=1 Tax=Streptomyces sp. Tue6028 TaxID=2036037 RepID=UPI003D713286
MTSTLIETSFGEEPTAAEVIEGVDLSGKQAVVAGAASSLGAETAPCRRERRRLGHPHGRNTDAGERTATGIRKATGNDAVHAGPLDLADRTSIAALTSTGSGPLHQRLFRPRLCPARPTPPPIQIKETQPTDD